MRVVSANVPLAEMFRLRDRPALHHPGPRDVHHAFREVTRRSREIPRRSIEGVRHPPVRPSPPTS